MNISKAQAIKRDIQAEEERQGAEFCHRVFEQFLDEQSVKMLECASGIHLHEGHCRCSLCKLVPLEGCFCELCEWIRNRQEE